MVDTRPIAREKAQRRAEELRKKQNQQNQPAPVVASPGPGFESERQRAKNAFREEIQTYDGTGMKSARRW